MKRNRLLYFFLGSLIVGLGLASRRYASAIPEFLAQYAGDTLWAAMVFVGIGFLAPRLSTRRAAIIALTLCYIVEISQLHHAPWIDSIRQARFVGLVLGYGFLWSDLACYTTGVGLSAMLEIMTRKVTKPVND